MLKLFVQYSFRFIGSNLLIHYDVKHLFQFIFDVVKGLTPHPDSIGNKV